MDQGRCEHSRAEASIAITVRLLFLVGIATAVVLEKLHTDTENLVGTGSQGLLPWSEEAGGTKVFGTRYERRTTKNEAYRFQWRKKKKKKKKKKERSTKLIETRDEGRRKNGGEERGNHRLAGCFGDLCRLFSRAFKGGKVRLGLF